MANVPSQSAARGLSATPASAADAEINVCRKGALPGLPGSNPELFIQAAIDEANANYVAARGQPTTVRIPAGNYICDLHAIPNDGANTAACFWRRSGVKILMDPGAVISLKDGAVLPGGCVSAHIVSNYNPWTTTLADCQQDYELWGGTIDGNANNNANLLIQDGLFTGASKNVKNVAVKVKNVYGNNFFPPGETFHVETNNSHNVTYAFCEVDGSGATDTGSGFSSDNSYVVKYIGCVAHDMTHAHGFTAWQSGDLQYDACSAWKCTMMGFNWERCDGIEFDCIVGGNTPHIRPSNPSNPFFPTDETDVHCGYGFNVSGTRNVVGKGQARKGNHIGLNIAPNTSLTAPTGTATTAIGSPTLTAVTTTAGVWEPELTVTGTGIPANTKILTVVGNVITLNKNATANGTLVAITGARNSESIHVTGLFTDNVSDYNVDATSTGVYLRIVTSAGVVSVG